MSYECWIKHSDYKRYEINIATEQITELSQRVIVQPIQNKREKKYIRLVNFCRTVNFIAMRYGIYLMSLRSFIESNMLLYKSSAIGDIAAVLCSLDGRTTRGMVFLVRRAGGYLLAYPPSNPSVFVRPRAARRLNDVRTSSDARRKWWRFRRWTG